MCSGNHTKKHTQTLLFLLITILLVNTGYSVTEPQRKSITERIGFKRGICVLPGDLQCRRALQLAKETEFLIYVQLTKDEDVLSARKIADDKGLLNKRIFIEKGSLTNIHLADNLADVVLTGRNTEGIPREEILRVLRPGGIGFIGAKKLTKPIPQGLDDWSHPYHGPDNNPQSKDEVIRAPYLTQFLADPRYGPLPQVAVASAGRVFKAFGHIAFKEREEPLLNTIVAFNGYNGTILWKYKLSETYMIHRSTIIATPEIVYVADDKSCKLIDAATGKLKDEIIPPLDVTGGTFWKWMALENGVLYAMVGQNEKTDPIVIGKRTHHGWPWNPLSPGFNQPENPWGFGKTVIAINPESKKVLWSYREEKPIDSRAVCMKNGKMFIFRFGSYLTCLDTKNGKVLWRKTPDTDNAIFASLGDYSNRQDWRTNWRTTAYLKCTDDAVYFAGPQVNKLLAVSAQNGKILWDHPYNNFQLILRDDAVYGISGQIDDGNPSIKFDPLTGKILQKMDVGRRACTRPTAAIDSIFFRASGGSVRLDTSVNESYLVSPMRPPCQDGVTIANGMLYWWPSVCDCNLTLYGITTLAPAGNFNYAMKAIQSERLETATDSTKVAPLDQTANDWPTFRANNSGTATTKAVIATKAKLLWQTPIIKNTTPTAPVTVDNFVFVSADDGIVRAFDSSTGKPAWKAYTGGSIRIAPTIANGRAFVGSGDGWAYAFEAKTGRQLWRFRAAPVQRNIPVYGSLLSTWPVASGVIVQDDTAYIAAGIVNYDGTHVYALDAKTGNIKWQNNTSGHLNKEAKSGVSVQGHMLLFGGKLSLAGGNAVSPAIYDITNGNCLNDPTKVQNTANNNVPASFSPRGSELYRIGNGIVACGKPFYAHPEYDVFDQTVFNKTLLTTTGDLDITWVNNTKIMCYPRVTKNRDQTYLAGWGKTAIPGLKPNWQYDCPNSKAVVICNNAVLVATETKLTALNLKDGKTIWTKNLPASPVLWGMAVDRNGKIILTLKNGQVLCFGK